MNKVWMLTKILADGEETELGVLLFNKHDDAADAFIEAVEALAQRENVEVGAIQVYMGMDENGATMSAEYNGSTILLHLHDVL